MCKLSIVIFLVCHAILHEGGKEGYKHGITWNKTEFTCTLVYSANVKIFVFVLELIVQDCNVSCGGACCLYYIDLLPIVIVLLYFNLVF